MKWFALSLGTLVGVSHIAMIGMLVERNELPIINLPVGEYTRYTAEVGTEGYRIDYRANDPKTFVKNKNITKSNGFFGIGGKSKVESYTEQHLPGEDSGKKLDAKTVACIEAAGGGKSQGRLVGASVGAAAAPWFMGIPYVGPMIGGFVSVFASDKGAEVGAEISTFLEDCEDVES